MGRPGYLAACLLITLGALGGCTAFASPLPTLLPATPTPLDTPTTTPTASATRAPTAAPSATPTPTPTNTPRPTALPTATRQVAVSKPELVERGSHNTTKVAFTFDMGSIVGSTTQLLDELHARGIRATYFVTGDWVVANPALLKAIVAGGHEVGNHSFTHPDFTTLDKQAMLEELSKTEDAVKRIAGISTHPFWRPPFGAYNSTVLQVAGDAGYRSIYWTLDSADWRDESTTPSVIARVVKYADPGAIIVWHGALKKTADAMPEIITQLRARGLQPTSLSDLLDHP